MLPLIFAVATATISPAGSSTPLVRTTTSAADRPVRAPKPVDEPRERIAPPPQPAKTSEVFGDPGQFVFEGDFGLSVQSRLDTGDRTTVAIAPRFGWFFTKNVALQVAGAYSSQDNGFGVIHSLSAGLGLRANAWLGKSVSVYPGAELGLVDLWATSSGPTTGNNSVTAFQLAAHLPLLFHATPHVFFGAGLHLIRLQPTESRRDGATTLSFAVLVGAWL